MPHDPLCKCPVCYKNMWTENRSGPGSYFYDGNLDSFHKKIADLTSQRDAAVRLLAEVYQHVGNHCPARARHVLPPGLRDRIRDVVYDKPGSVLSQKAGD